MAITTLDGLIAGMLPSEDVFKMAATAKAAGVIHTSAYIAGRPGAAVACTAGLAGEALTSLAGQIPFPATVSGKNIHVARLEAGQANGIGAFTLIDRLWQNSGFTVTSTGAQTVSSAAFPARDRDGTTNGVGVQIGLEVSATMGAGTPTLTVSYTNSAGTAGRTGTIVCLTTLPVGSFVPMTLQAGDIGVQSVQTVTQSATMTSGTYHLVAYRSIAMIPCPTANVHNDRDGVSLGLPRMYDNSVPFFLFTTSNTGLGITDGAVTWAQG